MQIQFNDDPSLLICVEKEDWGQTNSDICNNYFADVTYEYNPLSIPNIIRQSSQHRWVVALKTKSFLLEKPTLDCFSVANALKQVHCEKHFEFIFLTKSATAEEAMAALRFGAVDLLEQPFLESDLARSFLTARVRISRGGGADTPARSNFPAGMATDGLVSEFIGASQILDRFFSVNRSAYKLFPRDVIASGSWLMMLRIYQIELGGAKANASQIYHTEIMPASSALRRINQLSDLKLICREIDSVDARRVKLSLSECGLKMVNSFIESYRNSALDRIADEKGREREVKIEPLKTQIRTGT